MVPAAEVYRMPAADHDLPATMRTDVVESVNIPIFAPHDHDRFVSHIVDKIVAGIRDLICAAGNLPDPRPKMLVFKV